MTNSPRRKRLRHAPLVCALALLGCGTGDQFTGPVPTPDGAMFVRDVYPVLLRDCAFSNCHGASDRFFQIFGPGRNRLDPEAQKPDDPMTIDEVTHAYDRARSMLATADQLSRTLLLSKPLEIAAGGQGHKGVDDFGRNLYSTRDDPSYALLVRWAQSTGTPPTAAQVAAANQAAQKAQP